MPYTNAKNHLPHAAVYDALQYVDFDAVASIGNSQTINIAQARLAVPIPLKVYRLCVIAATVAGAAMGVNVVCQTAQGADVAATGTVPINDNTDSGVVPPTEATNGQQMFAVNPSLPIAAALSFFFFTPDNPDAIYPRGSILRFSAITTGAGSATVVKAMLLAKYYDDQASKPLNAPLNVATDL